ncbi:hypothetical protein SCAR479_02227 [Seiridium cardinale]|uniref:SPX domain-containing protein n=1 Tax=Seiridium cardinale TaxID=138064 RepID=A0ABR2X5D9_9PEZI
MAPPNIYQYKRYHVTTGNLSGLRPNQTLPVCAHGNSALQSSCHLGTPRIITNLTEGATKNTAINVEDDSDGHHDTKTPFSRESSCTLDFESPTLESSTATIKLVSNELSIPTIFGNPSATTNQRQKNDKTPIRMGYFELTNRIADTLTRSEDAVSSLKLEDEDAFEAEFEQQYEKAEKEIAILSQELLELFREAVLKRRQIFDEKANGVLMQYKAGGPSSKNGTAKPYGTDMRKVDIARDSRPKNAAVMDWTFGIFD